VENKPETPKLKARQELAIDALASGLSIVRAAETTGVSRRSIYNWHEKPEFLAALERRKQELRDRMANQIADLGTACITTIVDYLGTDKDSSYEPARVKTAIGLIDKMNLLASPRGQRDSKPASSPGGES
jgi:transposase